MTFRLFLLISNTFIALIILSCNISPDCSKYKNGRFYMHSLITKNKIIIERNDTSQVETDIETGVVTKSKIIWNNPCEYKITGITNNKGFKNGVDSFFAVTPIDVIIVSAEKNFYVFRITIDSANKHLEYSDTVRVAE